MVLYIGGGNVSMKTAFVKISGDLIGDGVAREDVLEWIRELAETRFVVICTGGGSQINKRFSERGFEVTFGPLGRETVSFEEKQLARDILEENQAWLQDLLASKGIRATVIIPVLDVGSVLCHVNGDIFVFTVYLGYHELYILTTDERVPEKAEDFKKYKKITVLGFPSE